MKRPGRTRAWKRFERIVLGAFMGTAAWLIERKLRKALSRMQSSGETDRRAATFGPEEGL